MFTENQSSKLKRSPQANRKSHDHPYELAFGPRGKNFIETDLGFGK